MAAADYYSCDLCGRKTFYDANLPYDEEGDLPGVGVLVCICTDCAKTHSVLTSPKGEAARSAVPAQAGAAEVDDLAALVARLVRALRKAAPSHDLPEQAMDYLRRKDLLGSPLRSEESGTAIDRAWDRFQSTVAQPAAQPPAQGEHSGRVALNAARYEWMRRFYTDDNVPYADAVADAKTGEELDAAIDAELSIAAAHKAQQERAK